MSICKLEHLRIYMVLYYAEYFLVNLTFLASVFILISIFTKKFLVFISNYAIGSKSTASFYWFVRTANRIRIE